MSNFRLKDERYSNFRKSKLEQELLQPNKSNFEALKAIEGIDPKYAKHMFLSNTLIEQFVKHLGGGLDLLNQPVCTHCEKPCAWDKGGSAYCFSCNKSIPAKDAITVKLYLLQETKGVSDDTLNLYVKGAERFEDY